MTVPPFRQLLDHPGVEEVVELRSPIGFMAFHGGNLERGTDTVAVAAGEASGASVYAVVQPPDLRWHIPSHQVTPQASPALGRFLDHVELAIALHGYGRHGRWTDILLGGTNRDLAHHLRAHLLQGLDGYDVVDDMAAIPPELRGLHPANPVNRPRLGGVQVELPPRVRGTTPHRQPLGPLIEALAAAARSYEGSTSNVPPLRQ